MGIDLVDLERLRRAHERFGERLARRLLCPDEYAYCAALRDPVPSIAARFAAKEAVAKAFGTGIGAAIGWHDIEVLRDAAGRPMAALHGRGLELAAHRGCRLIHISLTHAHGQAAAVAVLES